MIVKSVSKETGSDLLGKPTKWVRQYATAVLGGYGFPFLVYFLWRYWYFGSLLPNTYYAKTGGGFLQYLRGAQYTALFAEYFIMPLLPGVVASTWAHVGSGTGRIQFQEPSVRHLRTHIGLYACGLLVIAYTLTIVYVGGDYMAMFRFFVPVLPQTYLLLGFITYQLLGTCRVGYKRALAGTLLLAAVPVTALQSTPVEKRLFPKPSFMHGTYRGVQFERWAVVRFMVIGNFFRHYARSEDSLALRPIGVIPYVSGMRIHSIHGIVDPFIAHKVVSGTVLGTGFPGHEKQDLRHALSKKPTYVMLTSDLSPRPQAYPVYPEDIDKILRENYEVRSVWLNDTQNGQAGYFTFLELKSRAR